MRKTKPLTTEEYNSKHPVLSYAQYIKAHVNRYENEGDTIGSPLPITEQIHYNIQLGKDYLQRKKKQEEPVPTLSLLGILRMFKVI